MATNNAINLLEPIPSCASKNNADQVDVTGNGTVYAIQYTNEIYDNGNNFDAVSTFTAPRAGLYLVTTSYWISGVAGHTDCRAYLKSGGATHFFFINNPTSGTWYTNSHRTVSSTVCYAGAGQDILIYLLVSGGAKVIDLQGATASAYDTPYVSITFLTGL